jgi:drug/metabolite transporter (DMT)-like permease
VPLSIATVLKSRIILLVVGIAVVSWAGPLIRLATEAPPLVIAFWRTAIASAVLLPLALTRRRREVGALTGKWWAALVVSGGFLMLHFATWVASIDLTTIAASVLLVTSAPIWVSIASAAMGEPLPVRGWAGVMLAVAGAAVVGVAGISGGSGALAGNLLALAGAVAAAGYLIAGRRIRQSVSILTYAAGAYSAAALFLLVAVLATSAPLFDYRPGTWAAMLALALGPQLIGHTIFNFLLGDLEAWKVAAAVMGEPVGSAIIAAFLFAEIPGVLVFPGALLLFIGIGLAVGAGGRRRVPAG